MVHGKPTFRHHISQYHITVITSSHRHARPDKTVLSVSLSDRRESHSHRRGGRDTDKTVLSCLAWRCELGFKRNCDDEQIYTKRTSLIVRPHRMRRVQTDAAYCYRCSVVCVSVCLLHATMSCAKPAEPINTSFGCGLRWTQ